MKAGIFIFLIIFFFSFISLSSNALAWWNSNWQYRRNITINNTANSNTLTDYQVGMNITYDPDMQPNFIDIRFTWYNSTSNTEIEIPYWIEKKVDSSWAYVWVKVKQIPANGYATVYVYYKNSTVVSSASNGTNTFDFFDDFNDGNYDGWTVISGNWSVENGRLKFQSSTFDGTVMIRSSFIATVPFVVDSRMEMTATDSYSGSTIGILNGTTTSSRLYQGGAYPSSTQPVSISIYNGTWYTWTGSYTLSLNTNYYTALKVNATEGRYYADPEPTRTLRLTKDENFNQFASGYAMARVWKGTSGLVVVYYDDFKVRKYADPEPTYSIGAELSNQPPQYSDIIVSPSSPQTYGTSNIWFNISWQDEDGVDKAWIVHNFSGSSQTYLMSNDTTTHFYYLLNYAPSAGNYSYQFYANDTQGATKQTSTLSYTINKAETTIYLAINGTEDNVTFTYPAVTNTSAWKTIANGNLSLYRNGTLVNSSSQNEIEEVIQLSAGVYNYTATLEHQNYTAPPVTRILTINKRDSELTLTSSAGWTLGANTPTTITCTAVSPLTVSLYKNGVLVPNPYSVTPSFGIYNYTCVISDLQNYTPAATTNFLIVQTAGLGCTDNETYAFLLNITPNSFPFTLNFTDLVNSKYVKSDLSDVWINTSSFSITKNFTNGYYIKITNTTPSSSVEVKFGNYFANNSMPTEARAGTVYPVSNYEEISPYYVLNLVDEYDGSSLLPPSANTTLITFCNLGATNIPIKNTTFLVATKTKLDSVRFLVAYSATEIYYRDYQIRSNTEYKNIYLVDANKNQVVQMIINMIDNTRNFGNSLFKIKKYLGENLETMTENYFDAENKVIIYLMNGFTYQIFVDNGEEERNIGNFFVDAVDLTKTIIINPITTTNFTQGNISYYLRMESGAIIFDYYDYSGETYNTSMYVYNASNNELLYFTSSDNRSIVSFIYIVPDPNGTYDVRIKIAQGFYGNHSWDFWAKFGALAGTLAVPSLLPSLIGPNIMTGISVVGIISIPLFFGASHAGLAALIAVAFAGLFAYWGWYNVSVIVIVIAAVIAVLNKLREGKRE